MQDMTPSAARPQLRMAKTIAGAGTYPTAAARGYAIVFTDYQDFTTISEGDDGIPTLSPRCETYQAVAWAYCEGNPLWIPEGTPVWVVRHNAQWWILSPRLAARCSCLIKGAVARGTGGLRQLTAEVDNIVALDGGQPPTDALADALTVQTSADGVTGSLIGWNDNAPAVIVWDGEHSRWRIEQPPLVRFRMTEALYCGSNAEATIYDESGDLGVILAHDTTSSFSKMATVSDDTGALGIATIGYDRGVGKYSIAWMQTPGDFWGTLGADLAHTTASVTVSAPGTFGYTGVINGYNPFQTHGGTSITAYNHPAASPLSYACAGTSGDYCFCRWDIKAAKYWIVFVQPNVKGWQTLDVVTDVAVSVDPTTHVATVTPTKKRIQLPPWTTIADV